MKPTYASACLLFVLPHLGPSDVGEAPPTVGRGHPGVAEGTVSQHLGQQSSGLVNWCPHCTIQ